LVDEPPQTPLDTQPDPGRHPTLQPALELRHTPPHLLHDLPGHLHQLTPQRTRQLLRKNPPMNSRLAHSNLPDLEEPRI
ncbi:hypothetical protein ACRYCC_34270, partial [Actinomadura scrupuli]|uniref:hypothetical protein n=1 Tax=Actinomadura scrupuli TaxID=559629 RepID=UPI003D97373F